MMVGRRITHFQGLAQGWISPRTRLLQINAGLGGRRVLGESTPKRQMRAAGEDVLRLWSSHPHRLNDLEDGGADDYEDKEGNKFGADRVLVIVLLVPFTWPLLVTFL